MKRLGQCCQRAARTSTGISGFFSGKGEAYLGNGHFNGGMMTRCSLTVSACPLNIASLQHAAGGGRGVLTGFHRTIAAAFGVEGSGIGAVENAQHTLRSFCDTVHAGHRNVGGGHGAETLPVGVMEDLNGAAGGAQHTIQAAERTVAGVHRAVRAAHRAEKSFFRAEKLFQRTVRALEFSILAQNPLFCS